MQIYISGIHTDVGKTHFCASFCASFNYDYFKLIQAGLPKDSDLINKLSPKTKIFKEGFFLQTPASPHIGKILQKADYKALEIMLPQSQNLLIELAGGLFSPIDEKYTMIDFMSKNIKPTILVAKYYLGSINHILLSIQALKQRNIEILSLVMMGKKDVLQDNFVQNYTQIPIINLDFPDQQNALNQNLKKQIQNILNTKIL
ncbi:dethiobiotin synthase [Campylobacter hepaticus]|uniref:ATP-dependent dethiobiotin synthetase BioD n=1 Tax=Campylobacter hepaticus TaxID=1813019 RepID=A0A424Z3A1_9BACT|nr:ATP-dependent dethiobiotin synthetase BioD [Campylobacter hepaticus]AXP09409.1 ATP-dependent dethiobiotin synthetase BioD [Campylobacter hepaticus]MCZ0772846.1 dethiobiotin synthase [Campylobacter hepaticus]MCZ0774315.1 dethiobiotin synthase [Campylobacter hepaticus]MCZ0775567.1 dethiobiotin synthase [Campylobacter hepaticus]MDX2323150.1 ATP-dependent dethiobiotin synthetase BioD [Campylobacter hepaticus]